MNPRIFTFVAAMSAVSLMTIAQDAPKPAAAAEADPLASVPMDKVSYFIGRNIGKQMSSQGFKPDFDAIKSGMQDSVEKKDSKYPEAELKAAMEKFSAAMQQLEGQRAAAAAKASEAYLVENGKKKGVTTTTSGLQYEVIKAAEGPKPAATDTVKVHYKGTLTNGEEFDSSYARNEPAEFPLNGVIPGWTEGVQLMNKGSKFKFVIPGKLAYGEQGSPPKIGPNETLVFEVELLDIKGK
jgi:FKBP-type peptidyl-prolyl cis-trans isomerase